MQVMDALAMEFPDNSFDLVWACESGEHMPDKAAYVAEMSRVLKPGGTLVIATWCQREETPATPFRCGGGGGGGPFRWVVSGGGVSGCDGVCVRRWGEDRLVPPCLIVVHAIPP